MSFTTRTVALPAFTALLLTLAACSGGGDGGGTGCQPTAEICDGADNDCDGQTDEGLNLGAACSAGTGACQAAGTIVCATGGGTTCSAVAGTPGTETCNGADDDCDGTADDGFDTQTDAQNCGACGNVCSLPNATSACSSGTCTIAACDPGYVDLDPNISGCEYACTPTGAETCGNGVDDDCDGATDEGCTQVCQPSQSTCGTDRRTLQVCNVSGTAYTSETCPFYCDAGACVAATGLADGVVAACGSSAPVFAPPPGQTLVYRQGATDPEISCSLDCGGGTTVVTIPYLVPATGTPVRALCVKTFEIASGVVLTHDGSSPPPLTVVVDGTASIAGEIDFDGRDGGGNPGDSGRPGGAGGPGGDFGAAGCTFASCNGLAGLGAGGGGSGVAGAQYGGGGGGAGHETPGGAGGRGGTDGLGGFAGAGYGSSAAPAFGSGGGSGARGPTSSGSGPGGGGGGGIRIFARQAVSVTGIVSASGGRGGDEVAGSGGGGGGSGGAIRLEARAVGGPGVVRADGGNGGASGSVLGGLGATFSSAAQDGQSSATGGGGGGGGAAGFVVLQGYLDSDGDGFPDHEDTCPSVPGMCPVIYDLRTGLVMEGSPVALENVVVTAIDAGGTQQSMWIQDPFFPDHAGIRVYFGADPLPAGVAVGDLVIATGVYGEFDGASQLTSPTVTAIAAFGGIVPTAAYPLDIATGGALAEWLEGMLVTVQNVTVTTATNPTTGEFVVTNGLIVDDLIYAMPDQAVGTTYSSITGILHFANGDTKLEPRSAADVVP